jgi:hypothetical protein
MQNFIGESAIYQEAQIIKADPKKAIYRMTLQTCDEVNQNKRIYPKKVLVSAMESARERISKKLPGELDHPLLQGSEQYDGMRQTTVLLKEVSHYIRDFEFQGNLLVGECETASTQNGRDLLGLIMDRCVVGKSMRGLAELNSNGGVNIVQDPLYIITFDAVSLPSHKAATVRLDEVRFESKNLLTESCNGKLVCTREGVCYLADYFDKLVETKVIRFFDTWV